MSIKLGPVYMEKSWPGDPKHPPQPGEPSFPTIAYKSSSVDMTNCKPGSGDRVTQGVGSLG